MTMVHFYHEISSEELYSISSEQLQDVERLLESIKCWLRDHPDMLDTSI